jgi:hypothetical protein
VRAAARLAGMMSEPDDIGADDESALRLLMAQQ